MGELDSFLDCGYEELKLELKERKETRMMFSRFAELIAQISRYIVSRNKNTSKYFLRMTASSLSLLIILTNCRYLRLAEIRGRIRRVLDKASSGEKSAQGLYRWFWNLEYGRRCR